MNATIGERGAPTVAHWYFDFISPFAYLQWQRLRAHPLPVQLVPRPILFAAVLEHCGQRGPAEIPSKRRFTYRQVAWRASRDGVPLRFPPAHPFNPLAALRLCLAVGASERSVSLIFEHIWRDGLPAEGAASLAAVAAALGVADVSAAYADPRVKGMLRENTEIAVARGIFGVPTLALGEELFWGDDATEMARDHLLGVERVPPGEIARLDALPIATARI